MGVKGKGVLRFRTAECKITGDRDQEAQPGRKPGGMGYERLSRLLRY